ncbi:hypothetical protein [Nocardia neocaledoniensis]|uniref:hypothetical protein n=1 Tax=Nocardia neocaledoniensis TaxID=236511 RepID=UPI002457ECC6|nr:hypothetical protein [Nocardia neocaledoniensis]
MDLISENFVLYAISDDWSELGVFMDHVKKFHPEHTGDKQYALALIRALHESGYLEFGWLPDRDKEWTPWKASTDEAIHLIAHGYGGRPGILEMSEQQIRETETVRVNLTALGRSRLNELGDPYETYGDPWHDDPFLNAADWGCRPFDPATRDRL